MPPESWPAEAVVALWVGVGAGFLALLSIVLNGRQGRWARRADKRAEAQEKRQVEVEASAAHAEARAERAENRAIAAESRAIEAEARAEELARVSFQQEHDRLAPEPPEELRAEIDRDGNVFVSIANTSRRDYRLRALATKDNSSFPLGPPPVFRAGETVRVFIERVSSSGSDPNMSHVLFKFWPPVEVDGVDLWSCPCDRPADEGPHGSNGQPHWSWRLPLLPPRRPNVRFM